MGLEKELRANGLKVTPQRIAVLKAMKELKMHPTVDEIIDHIKPECPGIAPASVYKILEAFIAKGLVSKVKTEKDLMRYDAVRKKHHHLYNRDNGEITDYFDSDLDNLLSGYFNKKGITGYIIDDIKLHINVHTGE